MKLSAFAQKFSSREGIAQLMDDLGDAISTNRDALMLGGGNPGRIPQMEAAFARCLQQLAQSPTRFHQAVGVYGPPDGAQAFKLALARLLRSEFGWSVTDRNIALLNGSQNASFILFNMFAGEMAENERRHILLPITPEYIGYTEQGLSEPFFVARRPTIELIEDRFFKYRVDFDDLRIEPECGAICVSRPTNPTGNVLTDEEVARLQGLAEQHDIPLIVDNAYGTPFPNIVFTQARPSWSERTILCMSLSKIGLPGIRTGIIVAREDVIEAVSAINARLNLTTGTLGPALAQPLFESGEILQLSREVIQPFYRTKAEKTIARLTQKLSGLPARIHVAEGAIFLWLWFEDLPIHCGELYTRLKSRGVLVIPGHHFFPAEPPAPADESGPAQWRHQAECIRVNYSQDDQIVAAGVDIIADEVRRAYGER